MFFGPDELVKKAFDFVERLTPIALVGSGGIGKTSATLTILPDDRIERQFCEDRWSIRRDKLPTSLALGLR